MNNIGQDTATSRSCIACGGRRGASLFKGLVRCEGCEMVYYPHPCNTDETSALYNERYFTGAEYAGYLSDRHAHAVNFRRRVRQLLPWVGEGKRLFEVGCAYGLFLKEASNYWQVRGCDIAREPCNYAKRELGLDVVCGDLLTMNLSAGEVDVFCLWDTIEHLNALPEYLSSMAATLQPGGIIALTTGDVGSVLARLQGPRWRQIHPPSHLWYFSRATMLRTLQRFGFDVVWQRHVSMSRSINQIIYSLTSLHTGPSALYKLSMASGIGKFRLRLNTPALNFQVQQ